MGAQCLAKSEMTLPQDRQQIELVNLAEPVRYGEQSSINSIITIRWLSIFFCLAFWYGVYKLVNYVFLSSWIKGSDQNILITGRSRYCSCLCFSHQYVVCAYFSQKVKVTAKSWQSTLPQKNSTLSKNVKVDYQENSTIQLECQSRLVWRQLFTIW